ncbi:MAG: radical SAM protein [Kiritimatiellae bacterium]|nr:radical SAM protein [Kiritimatiellia bacterium]
MTGLVFDIKRGVTKDGPGLRTSVFLKGCPLRCAWCHNPESQEARPERAVTTGEICGREMTVEDVMEEVRRDKVFYAPTGGGLTITGGEPLAQPAFTAALGAAALAEGIAVAIDTSGFAPWSAFEGILAAKDAEIAKPAARPAARGSGKAAKDAESAKGAARPAARGSGEAAPLADLLFLYDLKCLDPARHCALTGVSNEPILANLRRLDSLGARLWIRLPLVPGLNDSDADLAALRDFLATLRHAESTELCPYHPLGLEKYAKFGKTPPFARREPATPAEAAHWKAALGV